MKINLIIGIDLIDQVHYRDQCQAILSSLVNTFDLAPDELETTEKCTIKFNGVNRGTWQLIKEDG